jgi:SAM-dependent methyltransferase
LGGAAAGSLTGTDAPEPVPPPDTLVRRFRPEDLEVFTEEESSRYLARIEAGTLSRIHQDPEAWAKVCRAVAWELLYRLDPDLYDQLTAGETLHPGIMDWLPARVETAVEVGAGTGRLTVQLAPRCKELIAVEPAAPLARRLEARLNGLGITSVKVVKGFFDAMPVRDGWAELVVACSSFTTDPAHGGVTGLEEMERICAQGGLVVIVWPDSPGWMARHGYETITFPGQLRLRFRSVQEAVELSRIFYPEAVPEIIRQNLREVPYETLGVPDPSSLSWKRKTASSRKRATRQLPAGPGPAQAHG